MDPARLLAELTRAAEHAGIAVRTEPFDPTLTEWRRFGGGLCTVRGRRIILIDASTPLIDRIATVAASLARVDLEDLFLHPAVRETIAAHAHRAPARRARRGVVIPISEARKRQR